MARNSRGLRIGRAAAAVVVLLLGCSDDTVELELVGTVERTLVELVAPAAETIVSVHKERGDRVAAPTTRPPPGCAKPRRC